MKKLFLWGGILCSLVASAQQTDEPEELQAPEKFFEVKVNLGLGMNVPLHLKSDALPHGLDVAQRANTIGFGGHLALAGEFKRRFGIELSAGMNGFSFRRKYFDKKFAERFSDFTVQGDENQDVTHSGGEGMDVSFIQPKIYFIINPKANNKLVPMAGVMFSNFNPTLYKYSLRTPSTNYFTVSEIEKTNDNRQPFYTVGLEVRRTFAATGEKGRISNLNIALRTSLVYGKYTADYQVTTTQYLQNPIVENIQVEHQLLYLNFTLSVNIFSY